MIEKTVIVKNTMGLHLRPASIIAKVIKNYEADIKLEKGNKTVNANSCLLIVSLGAKKGDEVKIIAEGTDEEKAMEKVYNIINASENEL